MLHLATVILAFNGVFAKVISLSAIPIICIRAVIAFMVLGVYMKISKRRISQISKRDLGFIVCVGALFAIHWVTFIHAIKVSTVAIGMLSLAVVPLFTSIIESIETKKRLHKWDIIAGGMVLVGIWFLVPEFSFDNDSFKGLLIGLLSALVFSLRNVMSKNFSRKYSGEEVMLIQLGVVALSLLPFTFGVISEVSGLDWIYLVIMGVFTTAVGHTMVLKGFEGVEAKSASVILNLQPLYAIFYAVLLLSEIPNLGVVVGGVLIISAVIGETVFIKKSNIH